MAIPLDYKKAVTTARQNDVRIYAVHKDYMIGAWYEESIDRWIPQQWTLAGYSLPNPIGKSCAKDLDLINVQV